VGQLAYQSYHWHILPFGHNTYILCRLAPGPCEHPWALDLLLVPYPCMISCCSCLVSLSLSILPKSHKFKGRDTRRMATRTQEACMYTPHASIPCYEFSESGSESQRRRQKIHTPFWFFSTSLVSRLCNLSLVHVRTHLLFVLTMRNAISLIIYFSFFIILLFLSITISHKWSSIHSLQYH
jgi:hypothetical protein